jgi:hypothetical protein
MNDEPDAYLREALRHAPDADVAAPPVLTDRILRAAREQAHSQVPARAAAPGALRRLFDWLGRAPVRAAFAGIVVATFIGMLWWPQAPERYTAPGELVASTDKPAVTAMPAAPPARRPEPTAESSRAERSVDAALSRRLAAPPAAEVRAKAQTADASNMAQSPPRPIDALLLAIDAEAGRWTWQRAGSAASPMHGAMRDWLSQLAASPALAWRRAVRQPPALASATPPALMLLLDGRPTHEIRIEGGAISLRIVGEPDPSSATLEPATAAALLAGLDNAAR